MDNIMAVCLWPLTSLKRAHTHTRKYTHFNTFSLIYANTYSHAHTYQRFSRSFASFVCSTHTHTREHVDTFTYTHTRTR